MQPFLVQSDLNLYIYSLFHKPEKAMRKTIYRFRNLIFSVFLLLLTGTVHAQEDTTALKLDWTFANAPYLITGRAFASGHQIEHNASKEDKRFYNRHKKLINAEPTEKNHDDYYEMARALWNLNKTGEAEKMLLKIVASRQPFYEETNHHSSGTTYGYGSYTSNYKHYAYRLLTEAYAEKKLFSKALECLLLADNKYPVSFTCGTGYHWHRNAMNGLYGICYEGLEMYDSIIKFFLPEYDEWGSQSILIRAIKKVYTQAEIEKELEAAENSVVCTVFDTESASHIYYSYGESNETVVVTTYTAGQASINLFGREVQLELPPLADGEVVSRELFLQHFKNSAFYSSLLEKE
jgi:tetratricopeptide (TPR) repeat protein